jgi:hypothetical protein
MSVYRINTIARFFETVGHRKKKETTENDSLVDIALARIINSCVSKIRRSITQKLTQIHFTKNGKDKQMLPRENHTFLYL